MNSAQGVETTLLTSILRHWKIGLVVAIVLFAAMVAVIVGMKPRYAAHTLLLLPSTPTIDLTQQTNQPNIPQTDPYLIRSYSEIILGDELCRTVIREFNLTSNPAFQPHESKAHRLIEYIKTHVLGIKPVDTPVFDRKQLDEDTAVILYKRRLSAFNDGRSLTLDLAFELGDPVLATKIVNAHAQAYIAAQIAYRYKEANIKVQWMKKQLDASAQQLHDAEVSLQNHVGVISGDKGGADQTAELKSKKAFADAQETVYTNLLNRYNMMAAERNYLGSDTRIVSPAIVPTHPKFPNTPLFVAIAGVVSLLGGAAAAWLASLFATSFDADMLAAELRTENLGTICFPRAGSMRGNGKTRRLRRALFWEQIRTVRSSLGANATEGAVILITSHSPNEGKSLLAASLARAVASSGTRTLLLDADMRRPSAHKLLDVTMKSGADDRWERAGADCMEAVIPVPGSAPLCLLSPWLLGADVDSMAGTRLRELLTAMRQQFRVIIIDSPPVGAVADALNIAELSDATIVVARSSKKSPEHLRKVIAKLTAHGARVRGLVLTRNGSASAPDYAHLGNVLANDRLIDVVPIPARRSSASSAADGPAVIQGAT